MKRRYFGTDMKLLRNAAIAIGLSTILAGCQTGEILNQGYVVDEQTLALAPVGSSREQVLLSLGTPSTTATFDTEVFYYISQKRSRPVAFMKPKLIEQSILTVYFNKEGNVDRLANYTMKDGVPFDMISRTTPTGGVEQTFLGQLLKGGADPNAAIRNALSQPQ
ncbi:outer membrane protein assembly factor BamE [Rhizobium sp. TRM96647]|uniref:outer membrane protein assembly factor BamE n=1 Tax=unclassified Rhizobium TaxID=2613769 RepID=UPI0021E75A29|nr:MULTISPECIES: outer membrane protein assembly factor BamE [unclassified Rhizobium]MCV3738209.1 outer membrane protein assembly factor BamE [Rhizobium sp. TRM96647]MCV3760042.1 outer membrane protein assembly factor BamE [Rhizobium sp. TRM96650]